MFDFVGTLARMVPSREDILLEIMFSADADFDVSPEKVQRVFLQADSKMPYSSLRITEKHQRKEFYVAYNSRVLELLGFPEVLSGETVYEHFTTKLKRWELVEGATETLEHFRALGFRLAVLSNFDAELETVVAESIQLRELVDDVVSSARLGVEKPNSEFFNLYLKDFDFDPRSSFYVGDSYELDYLPARQVGLRAFLVDPYEIYPGLPGSVSRLQDLVADFENLPSKFRGLS